MGNRLLAAGIGAPGDPKIYELRDPDSRLVHSDGVTTDSEPGVANRALWGEGVVALVRQGSP